MTRRTAGRPRRAGSAARRIAGSWIFGEPPGAGHAAGWAARSLERALLVAVLPICLLWVLLLIPLVLEPWRGGPLAGLAILHVGVAVLLVLAVARRLPAIVPILGQFVLVALGWTLTLAENSGMALATAWSWDFALISAAFLLKRRPAIVVCLAAAAAMPAVILLGHPDWSSAAAIANGATGVLILGVGRAALPPLHAFASRVDAAAAVADEERRASESARAASMETSEAARTLHDTAINTLGAIANGGAAIRDVPAVRERCRHDLEALEAVLRGDGVRSGEQWRLPGGLPGSALSVSRSGLGDDELELLAPAVPVPTRQAVASACTELLQNAARHSGSSAATVEARLEGRELVVTVADGGRGFDGRPIPGRGLAESVIARMADVGVAVAVDTAPGAGTRVSLRVALDSRARERETADPGGFEAAVAALQRRAALSWAAGVVAVGILLEIADRSGWATPTQAMLAVAALTGLLVARFGTERRRHPLLKLLAFAAIPATYLLGFAGVGFGLANVSLWQTLGPTVPLVLLQLLARRAGAYFAALGLLVVTAVGTALAVEGSVASHTAFIGGLAPTVTAIGWFIFHRGLASIGRRAESDARASARTHLETATREAIDVSRGRWRAAGIQGAVDVLGSIASGEAMPGDERLQRDAGREEAYLRQLTQLSPQAIRMGVWFARVLREAYRRRVRVTIRSGDVDVDEVSAARLGELALTAMLGASPGSGYVVGLFRQGQDVTLTIVGPADELGAGFQAYDASPGWSMERRVFGTECLVELTGTSDEGTLLGSGEGPEYGNWGRIDGRERRWGLLARGRGRRPLAAEAAHRGARQ